MPTSKSTKPTVTPIRRNTIPRQDEPPPTDLASLTPGTLSYNELVAIYTSAASTSPDALIDLARTRHVMICDTHLIQIECQPRNAWKMKVADFENGQVSVQTERDEDLSGMSDAEYWAHAEWRCLLLLPGLEGKRIKQFELCGVDGCIEASVGPCPDHR